MEITIACKQCQRKHTVSSTQAGKQIRCQGCGATLSIPVPRGLDVRPPSAEPKTDQVRCPHCHSECRTRPEWRGRRIVCPTCHKSFQLGFARSASSISAPRAPVADDTRAPFQLPSHELLESEYDSSDAVAPHGRSRHGFRFPKQLPIWIGVGVTVLVVLAVLINAVSKLTKLLTVTDAGPQELFPVATAVVPVMPARTTAHVLEPGVLREEIRLASATPTLPGHAGKLWLYLPQGSHEPKSLPCVLIAPAGTPLVTGMDLGDGDVPEHLPYVKAGFAVLAYELDGACGDMERASNDQVARAITAFRNAQAGLVNARIALEFVLAKVPEVDGNQIYSAGHSSAATLSLLFAEHEPRLSACVAYAPAVDVPRRMGAAGIAMITALSPGAREFIARSSPKAHEHHLSCPVFLFHALDDSNVPVAESQACGDRLKQLGKDVKLATVPTGDHYNSMLYQGIPMAIQWLQEHGAKPKLPIQELASAKPQMPNRSQPPGATAQNTPAKNNDATKTDDSTDKALHHVQDSGPGWELIWPPGTNSWLLTHHRLGYQIAIPISWQRNDTGANLVTVIPADSRDTVLAFTPPHTLSGGLGGMVRVETMDAQGEKTARDLLIEWERDARKQPGFTRNAKVEPYTFQNLPAARLLFTIKDKQQNADFEINAVRRGSTFYVVTIAAANEFFGRTYRDDLAKCLQSFKLVERKEAE